MNKAIITVSVDLYGLTRGRCWPCTRARWQIREYRREERRDKADRKQFRQAARRAAQ